MFCRRCNIHFSEGPCPSCGLTLEATPVEGGIALARTGSAGGPLASAAPAVVSAPGKPPLRAQAPEGDERTRTENLSADPWAPGSRVAGKYEVIGPLGSGGFGTVYKVRHIFRKKYYALKTPHAQFVKDEVFRRRFEREIEAMERFVHPDAVMIRDCGMTELGIPYYTMDFIDGESLKAALQRERRLAPERAVKIVRRVLKVLEVAHENGVIHRDIKPDNILLTRGGGRELVKVLDFGVAKLLDLVGWTSITHEAMVGTPRYMSPEQITGDPVDARSDLFSLGIIFYEMVTGEHPFARDHDPIRVTASILNRVPVPPRDLVTELPRQVSEQILWMLEKKPRKRPAGATAVLEALQRLEEQRSRLEARGPLSVYPGVPRATLEGLVLRQETREGERRSFLLFKETVTFGRSAEAQGAKNDLVLRCLPCRSAETDPDNWRKNLTISQRLGSVRSEGPTLILEPDQAAQGGISLSGVKILRPVHIQSDRFHLSLGDRALEIDGYRRLRRTDREGWDVSFLGRGRPGAPLASAAPGYGQPGAEIDHVHLKRANNFPSHEYFLVFRLLALGSAADAGLHLPGDGIEGEHGLLIFEGGEAFLTSSDGDVRVIQGSGEVTVQAGTFYPVVPGIEICLGSARLLVEPLSVDRFKKV